MTRQAELDARLKEIATLKASISTDNSAAIEAMVRVRLAGLEPAPLQPTEEQFVDAIRAEIVAARIALPAFRFGVTLAVKQVTDEFEAQHRAAKDEISKLQAAGGAGGVTTAGAEVSEEETKKGLENAKKEMEQELRKVQKTMQEKSTKREEEITDRLTAEIKKLQASASSSTPTAPPPDVDALVQQKLAQLEEERSDAQVQAIRKPPDNRPRGKRLLRSRIPPIWKV
ncbi:hypothetical protein JCM5350_006131 [Sporobolomyces pararoseus]